MATATPNSPQLAVITGASSGIGLELARQCAQHNFDLLIAADRPTADALNQLRSYGTKVEGLELDLSRSEGVTELYAAIGNRPVAVLMANAGHGLGRAFLDQDIADIRHVVDTNITGTIELIHRVGHDMRLRGDGRILITGSIAGFEPGAFQAVYNGTKAFIDSFAAALRNELKDTGVSVTCLMPGVTDTEFFVRADLMDTKMGTQDNKADPAEVARIGFDAMMSNEGDVIAGLKNKLTVAISTVTPSSVLAEQHRKMAEPGTAKRDHH
ncbi:MAG TPA: SDR family NAD(P)-dependent oxidoreductase [Steroidobacteraceae bacterium]|nr:SDR family NAD(P)-dependent oxidoreductase [Steroidobacteraceae bacterium]